MIMNFSRVNHTTAIIINDTVWNFKNPTILSSFVVRIV
jgi:hypothetical protein